LFNKIFFIKINFALVVVFTFTKNLNIKNHPSSSVNILNLTFYNLILTTYNSNFTLWVTKV
jgi:hypothetical protein